MLPDARKDPREDVRTLQQVVRVVFMWQAEHATPDLLRTSSRRCYVENGPVEFKLIGVYYQTE